MSVFPTGTTAPLASFLVSINKALTRSVWLRVFDNPVTDDPKKVQIPDARKPANDIKAIELANASSKAKAKKK